MGGAAGLEKLGYVARPPVRVGGLDKRSYGDGDGRVVSVMDVGGSAWVSKSGAGGEALPLTFDEVAAIAGSPACAGVAPAPLAPSRSGAPGGVRTYRVVGAPCRTVVDVDRGARLVSARGGPALKPSDVPLAAVVAVAALVGGGDAAAAWELSFATRLSRLIWAHGTTPSLVADEIGCTRAAVSHYLSGRKRPSDERIGAMSRLFQVDPAWLSTGEGAPGRDIPEPLALGSVR